MWKGTGKAWDVTPPTNIVTASKATDDPKEVIEDCEQTIKGMLVESNRTSKTTMWAGEGKGKGKGTMTKKRHKKFKNNYDKVLNLKQRKNGLGIYHQQEYHDEAQTLISASQWNSNMDLYTDHFKISVHLHNDSKTSITAFQ
ncbi:hypothetical protein BS17DRAFT_769339 [Gyrodon lividus]|nr:hypothetical protein BS17DRAFT_769339 [Gyrodon lividus]